MESGRRLQRAASGKPPTPNLDRMLGIHDQSQAFFEIIEFLEESSDFRLARVVKVRNDVRFFAEGISRKAQAAVGRYFGVDLDEADRERDRLLDWVREQNAGREAG